VDHFTGTLQRRLRRAKYARKARTSHHASNAGPARHHRHHDQLGGVLDGLLKNSQDIGKGLTSPRSPVLPQPDWRTADPWRALRAEAS